MRRSKLDGAGNTFGHGPGGVHDPLGRQYPARAHKLSGNSYPLRNEVRPYGGYMVINDPEPNPVFRFVEPTGSAVEKLGDFTRDALGIMVLIKVGQRPEDHPDWNRPSVLLADIIRAIGGTYPSEAKP